MIPEEQHLTVRRIILFRPFQEVRKRSLLRHACLVRQGLQQCDFAVFYHVAANRSVFESVREPSSCSAGFDNKFQITPGCSGVLDLRQIDGCRTGGIFEVGSYQIHINRRLFDSGLVRKIKVSVCFYRNVLRDSVYRRIDDFAGAADLTCSFVIFLTDGAFDHERRLLLCHQHVPDVGARCGKDDQNGSHAQDLVQKRPIILVVFPELLSFERREILMKVILRECHDAKENRVEEQQSHHVPYVMPERKSKVLVLEHRDQHQARDRNEGHVRFDECRNWKKRICISGDLNSQTGYQRQQ